MKAILVIDVPTLDDGRHLCNECPLWNRDFLLCEYDFNTEAKGCPLKPMPEKKQIKVTCIEDVMRTDISFVDKVTAKIRLDTDKLIALGYNWCLEEITGETE